MNRWVKFILPLFLSSSLISYSQPCLTPSVSIVLTPSGTLCAADIAKFTATALNTGPSPTIRYDFKVNGFIIQSGTSNFFITNSLFTGDIVVCDITVTGSACFTTNTASSNAITVTITPLQTPQVGTCYSLGPCNCLNCSYHMIACNSFTGGGQLTFTYYKDGVPLYIGPSDSYDYTSLVNGNTLQIGMMVTGGTCLVSNTVYSNILPILIPSLVTPSAIILASSTQICQGESVTFTGNIVLNSPGASISSYQWLVNGHPASNSAVFTTSTLQNGDNVFLVLITSGGCLSTNNFTSNAITINVSNNIVTPSINISPSSNPVCPGDNVTFKATPQGGGNAPSYKWFVNGQQAGTDSVHFTGSAFNNGDVISCQMTSNAPCVTSNTAISNDIVVATLPFCPDGIFVPSAFTPNGDGKNDLLVPITYRYLIKYKFAIYNRWGQKVFESQDPQKGWDGKLRGTALSSETFVWYCSYQFFGKSPEERKGTVTLIR